VETPTTPVSLEFKEELNFGESDSLMNILLFSMIASKNEKSGACALPAEQGRSDKEG
jgi:hypothetical protein